MVFESVFDTVRVPPWMNVAALDRRSDGSCDGVHLYVYGRPLTTAPCSMRGGNYSYFSWSDGRCRCSESTSSHVSRPDDIHADICALRGPHLQLDQCSIQDPRSGGGPSDDDNPHWHCVPTSRCRVTDRRWPTSSSSHSTRSQGEADVPAVCMLSTALTPASSPRTPPKPNPPCAPCGAGKWR